MNYQNVTGVSPSNKLDRLIQFESTLEYSAIQHFEFDLAIPFYEEQPLTIFYEGEDTSQRRYTPDFLVKVKKPSFLFRSPGNYLIEIKHRSDLKKNWQMYKPKFKAAVRCAKEHGMKFKILTEKELRTVLLDNIVFLNRYKSIPHDTQDAFSIMEVMTEVQSCSVNDLLMRLSSDKWYQAKVIPYIWNRIFRRLIKVDLNKPLNMNSELHW